MHNINIKVWWLEKPNDDEYTEREIQVLVDKHTDGVLIEGYEYNGNTINTTLLREYNHNLDVKVDREIEKWVLNERWKSHSQS